MTSKALVVLSGGQDSVTTLFWAKKRFEEVHAITFDYNQRHRIEIEAAKKTAKLAGVASHEVVVLGPILEGRSPLTNSEESLEKYESYQEMDKVIGDRVELTFVPMRNTLFLTIAANRAVCKDVYTLVTGVCQADNSNYPDCRQAFINSISDAINDSLGFEIHYEYEAEGQLLLIVRKFNIATPLMNNSKAETVHLALSFEGCYEALAYSHTSYDGAYPPTDNNHSNVLRAQGFEDSGYPDPLVLRAWNEGLMALPGTSNYNKIREKYAVLDGGPFRISTTELAEILQFARS